MKQKLLPPAHKERHLLKYRSTQCLNCHHPLDISDEYCPNCSQLNSTKKLAFNDFFNEFFAGIFAYDSRFYRTLGVLLLKPGKISKDYIEGKRVRYANPYRFYLSASILFFLMWSFTFEIETPEITEANAATTREELRKADSVLQQEKLQNPELEVVLPILDTTGYQEKYVPEKTLDTMKFLNATMKRWEVFSSFYDEKRIRNSHTALDSMNYKNSGYNNWFYKKTVDAKRFSDDPSLFISYFISKLPFIIFFYLPVFALFIWLLYLRRPFTYMEHLIFTFHNQTTWFVFFGISILADSIFDTNFVTGVTTLVFLFYLYRAFRTFYGQGRVKTILKFIIINFIFLTLSIVAAAFSLAASFAIY